MTYATTGDVETELGRSSASAEETSQWAAWLARVERAIVRRFARAGYTLADQIAAGDPSEEDVADIEVAAVVRKILNPAGITSITRTIDDGTLTTRREGTEDSGLDLTDEEWSYLLPNGGTPAAFSTRPGFEPDTPPVDLTWT